MPSELGLVKREIIFRDKADTKNGQILLEGDMIVPDIKPDIENILKVCGKVSIGNVKAEEGRVSFNGVFNACVIYESANGRSIINSMTSSFPIDEYIAAEEAARSSGVRLKSSIEHMEYRLINDRKVSIKAVIGLSFSIVNEKSCNVVTGAAGGGNLQTKTENICLQNRAISKRDIISIKEDLMLPQSKREISDIIESDASITEKETRVGDGKVHIKGEIKAVTLYTGEGDESIIELAEHIVPFNGYVEVPAAKDGMPAGISVYVDRVEAHPAADSDGEDRIIDFSVDVGVDIRLFDTEEVSVIKDAYSLLESVDIERENIRHSVLVSQSAAENSVKGVVNISDKYPDVFRVVKIWGEIKDYDARAGQDKVEVEGTIGLNTLYIGNDDNRPVNSVYSELPFFQEIEAGGASEGMDVDLDIGIKDIIFNTASERDVDVRADMDFNSTVTQQVEDMIITDILPSPGGIIPDTSSVVVYFVQPGDTLWNIAKEYNSTIEEIAAINDIKNWDGIYPGQPLIILKRVME